MEEQRTDIELGRSTTVKPSISMLEVGRTSGYINQYRRTKVIICIAICMHVET